METAYEPAVVGVPLIVPHNLDEVSLRGVLDRLDGVLLSGGGDLDPALFGEKAHPAHWQHGNV